MNSNHLSVRGWGSGGMGKWGVGCGGMGKWGSGEIELKPQNPKTPKPKTYLLTPQNENFVSHH
ncbi:MAG: hypothetical protein EWV81_12470 [Microcystis aeruginosa Ma_SC_T_19800800_S464]|uniref:Uncharacterized protein n=1 Tax=Microcystis aeruginosa Ma_SC_T_19800800_S464 TaxID=2486257 RepID=A0A552DSQ9_MICAE|nr:MAG: hypothetical protein EWV81_12470 [Microcystis aeruginosa Ma_SC_T_19800800_S464]